MSYGSILFMCFLMFVLGGQDRLSWAPGPPMMETAVVAERASPTAAEGTPERVRVASAEESGSIAPLTVASTRPGPPTAKALSTALSRPHSGAAVACEAGFPLSLPPEAPDRYALLDWAAEDGRAATIRYAFAGGGVLEFTQSVARGTEEVEAESPPPLPLPSMSPAPSGSMVDIAWQNDGRRFGVRSYGLAKNDIRAWIGTLATVRAACAGAST